MLKTRKGKIPESLKSGSIKPISKEPTTNRSELDDTATESPRMRKSIANATSVIDKWTKPSDEDGPIEEAFTYEDIIIGNIILDTNNARTRHILPNNPTHNNLDPSHPDYQENQETIKDLIELAEEFKTTPLQSSIGVYSYKGKYKTLFGARRFLAMKIAFGDRYKISCKVYEKAPKNIATARFIENSSRKDLIFSARIQDFKASYNELRGNVPEPEIYKHMGLAKTSFYYLKKVCDHDKVYEAVLNKIIQSQDDALYLINNLKDENIIDSIINLSLSNKITVSEAIPLWKNLEDQAKSNKDGLSTNGEKRQRPGRARKFIAFPKLTGTSAIPVVKKIIEGGLKNMNWENVDWNDIESVTTALEKNISALMIGEKTR